MKMLQTKVFIMLCAAAVASSTSIATRLTNSSINSQILKQVRHSMTWNGRYLELNGSNAESLQFQNYPTADTAGEFKTIDGNCLTISKSNGFPTIELGECDNQLFTPMSATNQIRIENPPIGVCAEEESERYFKICDPAEAGDLCLVESDGFVAVRPCIGSVEGGSHLRA